MTGDSGGGLTPGDPLGGDAPATPARPTTQPEAPAGASYGAGRVPPGAFAPRERDEIANPFAGASPTSWGRRAVAAIIDAVIVSVVALLVLLLAFLPMLDNDRDGIIGWIVVALLAVVAVSIGALLYAPLIMARTNGKTFGKMAMGCRVVRSDGKRVDFLWAALREVVVKGITVGFAASLTAGIAYLVDIFWPFVDKQNRSLHDIVVDSRVVDD